MKKKSTLVLFLFVFMAIQHGFSQTAYRTVGSGMWNEITIWERTTNVYNPTPTWVPAASGQLPTTNNIVYIRNGHTVTLDASKNCLNLIIETGGRLSAGSSTNAIRVGAPSSGFAGTIDTLTVNGTLGGPGELMPLELPAGAASLWVRGTGTIEIGRIRPNSTANLNYPGSGSTNAAAGARLLIDNNIRLNTPNNYAYSALNSNANATDSLNFTILAGRTVTVVSPTGYFHNPVPGSVTGGLYVYNVNGTLDLSANLDETGGSKLIPFANANSSITLNVGGILKLGAYFKADTVSTSLGALNLNINNGGLVDASLTTKFIVGTTGAATATPNIFFVTNGTGALRRTVPNDGTKIEFPIGTSTNNYNLAVLNSTAGVGAAEVYTVNVKNSLTNPFVSTTSTALAKEWNITEGTPGGNSDTLRLSWTTADEVAAGYTHSPVDTVKIIHWTGAAWDTTTAASVTGTGTLTDPYVAKSRTPFTTFSPFGIAFKRPGGTTPVNFVNVRGTQQANSIQVDFANATELDVVNYVIEKSTDGRSFAPLTTLLARTNNGALNRYSFTDISISNGNNFYRIKATERSGRVLYSSIIKINVNGTKQGVSVYPNPVSNHALSVQLENLSKAGYSIAVINKLGQQVYTKQINHTGGSATVVLNLPAVAEGLYHLQITSGQFRTVKNILIQ